MKRTPYNLTYRIFNETVSRLTSNKDRTADRCYVTTNEYLSDYMKTMNLKDKKLATVGSSGDQFFVALLNGCKDVTIIDANPYTKLFVEYKMAIIKNLEFNEFLELIFGSKIFHTSTYAKISHSLSTQAKLFWDTLMLEQAKPNEFYDVFDCNKLARQLIHPDTLFNCDFYKDIEEYNRLQNLLNEKDYSLKFKTANLYDFSNVLKDKYDAIMLSNIYAYHKTNEEREKFEKLITTLYKHNLNKSGTIQLSYDYRFNPEEQDPKTIGEKKVRLLTIEKPKTTKGVYFLDKDGELEL